MSPTTMNVRSLLRAAKLLKWMAAYRLALLTTSSDDDFTKRVTALHRVLHVPPEYAQRGLQFHWEAKDLMQVVCGPTGERHLMTPRTEVQWQAMRSAAANAGISLLVQWGFRSAEQQADLIRDEMLKGRSIGQLLNWIAAPGYSEHHTGRALDIGSQDCFPVNKSFANTDAYRWLCQNAHRFGFALSYPEGNPQGIDFEPWHWCFSEPD